MAAIYDDYFDSDAENENDENTLVDPPVTRLDALISDTLLKLPWDTEGNALFNAESHIILAQESVSATPTKEQSDSVREDIVYVFYVKGQFDLVDGYQKECDSISGEALLTFGYDEYGLYYLKEFRELTSSADDELMKRFATATKELAEKEIEYTQCLKDSCWLRTGTLINEQKAQGIQAGDVVYSPRIDHVACDTNGDGHVDLYYGAAVEMLRPWE